MFDVAHIVQSGGLLLIALLIFGESGMFIGFFFPGDTLLLSAGIFAAQGKLSVVAVIAVVSIAAIAGDNVGYRIGRRFGPNLFKKPDSVIFQPKHIKRAHEFFEKYGDKTMLFAHFVPIVRTFAPAVAGTAKMPVKRFFIFDAIGDIAWAAIVTLVGYWFGSKIPNIDRYIMLAVIAVVLITLVPAIYHLSRAIIEKRHRS